MKKLSGSYLEFFSAQGENFVANLIKIPSDIIASVDFYLSSHAQQKEIEEKSPVWEMV